MSMKTRPQTPHTSSPKLPIHIKEEEYEDGSPPLQAPVIVWIKQEPGEHDYSQEDGTRQLDQKQEETYVDPLACGLPKAEMTSPEFLNLDTTQQLVPSNVNDEDKDGSPPPLRATFRIKQEPGDEDVSVEDDTRPHQDEYKEKVFIDPKDFKDDPDEDDTWQQIGQQDPLHVPETNNKRTSIDSERAESETGTYDLRSAEFETCEPMEQQEQANSKAGVSTTATSYKPAESTSSVGSSMCCLVCGVHVISEGPKPYRDPPIRVEKRARTTNKGNWSGDTMKAAVKAVEEDSRKVREVSRSFGIPYSSLLDRIHGKRQTMEASLGQKPVFTTEQEKEITTNLLKLGSGPTQITLRRAAFEFAESNQIPNKFNASTRLAGKGWVNGFVKRNPELSLAKEHYRVEKVCNACVKPDLHGSTFRIDKWK